MTCSKCRKQKAEVKLRGAVLCIGCLINAAAAGVDGAERIVIHIHRKAAKRRREQLEAAR
jgi:hypothetical protein